MKQTTLVPTLEVLVKHQEKIHSAADTCTKEIFAAIPSLKAYSQFIDLLSLENSYTNGAIIHGDAGVGKSKMILEKLEKSGKRYKIFNTYTTPLSLYELLYNNRDKIIVLDDISQLLNDKKAVAILKSALFNPSGKRYLTYSSTSKVLEERGIPDKFVFNGQIIIILNEIPKTLRESFQALLSRVYSHKIQLTLKEKIDLVRIVFKHNSISYLTNTQKAVFLKFLESLVGFSNIHRYNVRTAMKCAEIFKSFGCDIEECKELFYSLLGTEPKLRKFITIETEADKRFMPVEKRIEIFKQVTGYSRREYFNIKSKYYTMKFGEQASISNESREIKLLMNKVGGEDAE